MNQIRWTANRGLARPAAKGDKAAIAISAASCREPPPASPASSKMSTAASLRHWRADHRLWHCSNNAPVCVSRRAPNYSRRSYFWFHPFPCASGATSETPLHELNIVDNYATLELDIGLRRISWQLRRGRCAAMSSSDSSACVTHVPASRKKSGKSRRSAKRPANNGID